MALPIIIAVALGVAVVVVLASFAKQPRTDPSARNADIDSARFHVIVSELLRCMGLDVIEDASLGRVGASRVVAVEHGSLPAGRHIVYIEARPAGHVVDARTLRALAADVARDETSVGMVVTPCYIARAAVADLAVDLQLIDGPALVVLVNGLLPARAREMQRYCFAGAGAEVMQPWR